MARSDEELHAELETTMAFIQQRPDIMGHLIGYSAGLLYALGDPGINAIIAKHNAQFN